MKCSTTSKEEPMGKLTDMAIEMTEAQKLMVADGMPANLLIPEDQRKASWKGVRALPTKEFFGKEPKAEAPDTVAFKKELEAKARAEAKAKKAALKEERIIRERLKSSSKPGPAEDQKQETTMKTAKKASTKKVAAKKAAAKPAKKAAAKKAATQKARTPVTDGKPNVVEQIAEMMKSPNGASMAEMVEATGIDAHPMRAKIKAVRDRLGLKTEAPSKANGFRYFIRG